MSEIFEFGYEVNSDYGIFVFETAEAAKVFEKFINNIDKIIKDEFSEEEINILLENCPDEYLQEAFGLIN